MTKIGVTTELEAVKEQSQMVGGILESEFVCTGSDGKEIEGILGTKINSFITPNSIEFKDDANPHQYYFIAEVLDGILTFDIKTEAVINGKNKKHDDLHATALALMSLKFFDDQGTNIHTLELNWLNVKEVGRNYGEFYKSLGIDSGQDISHFTNEQIESAIFNTWSGKLAKILRFSNIIYDSGKVIWQNDKKNHLRVRLKRDN